MDWFALAISGETRSEQIRAVEQPRIAGGGGEQHQLTNNDEPAVVLGRPALDIALLVGHPKAAAFHHLLPGPRLTIFRTLPVRVGFAMDLFTQLFGNLLVFVYHCFDHIVRYGYLSGLSRPERW
jgi:hypothetical protein